jgi:hypothetical protein
MDMRAVKNRIAIFRRHFNLEGQDVLACYDTAVVALFGPHALSYITVSVSPSNYKKLKAQAGEDAITKHPGSGVDCILVFGDLYVRAEARIPDQDVLWSSNLGIYSPRGPHLCQMMDSIILGARSTKKQIEHAKRVNAAIALKTNGKKELVE